MNNEKVVNQIVEYIPTINFDRTAPGEEAVSVFETTIRYLGGLLSGRLIMHSEGMSITSRTHALI